MLEMVAWGGDREKGKKVTAHYHLAVLAFIDFIYSLILHITFPLKIFYHHNS